MPGPLPHSSSASRMRRLPFVQLQAFEAVARLGSYKDASSELEGSNVSKHVAALESRIGVELLLSSPRGRLTREGYLLATYLTRCFDDIAALLAQLQAGELDPDLIAEILCAPPPRLSSDK